MIPIRIHGRGGIGNRVFQYFFSKRLESMIPGAEVVNASLPEFGIRTPDVPMPERTLVLSNAHRVDALEVAHLVRSGMYDAVLMRAYVQRLEYYAERAELAALLPAVVPESFRPIDPDALLINVRGGEILQDLHPDYGPVPADFFSQVADSTGLTPVIVGQLADDPYSEEIRRRFAGCEIRESVSPASDFELVRSARNVVFGVSTFSWLGAWLSPNAQNIHMPVSGIFNPAQRSDIDLLPVGDSRYHFYDFPNQAWTASPEQVSRLVATGSTFPTLTAEAVRDLRLSASVEGVGSTFESAATDLALLRNEVNLLKRRNDQLITENEHLRLTQTRDADDEASVLGGSEGATRP